MSSNNQYSNWNGWVPTPDGHQAQEEDGQGPYHPYYQSAPRGDNVDDLTQAFGNTTVQDDPSQGQDGYNDQYGQYTSGNYYPSGVVDTGSMAPIGEEGQSQAYIPTAPSYNPVRPSGNKRGDKGSRNTNKGPGDKNKGGKVPSSKEQRSKGQQSQSAMYGGPDPFFNPEAQNLADAGAVVDSPQDDAAYHHHQAPYGMPSDQQNSTAFVGGYGYGRKPYNDGYRPPRQTKPPKKSTGKQKETPQQWVGDSVPAYGNEYENAGDGRDSTGQDEGYDTGFEESLDDGYGTGDVNTSSGPSAVPYPDPYPGPEDEADDDGVKTPTRTSPMLQPTTMEYQDDELNNYYPVYPEPSFTAEDDPRAGPGEILDNRYVIENSSRFAPGEVFKTLWSEPLGSSKNENMTEVQVRDHMGQKFYVGVRRFIVVANDEGNCTCVPILTYERRGCTKKGVKANKHGIVYPSTGRAFSLPNEPSLGFRPVRLKLDHHAEKLARESRINYAKLTTIEHNIKVLFIGRIVREDFNVVTRAVEECWAAKLHRAGERSSKQQGGGGGNRRR